MIRTIFYAIFVTLISFAAGIPAILLFIIFPRGQHVTFIARIWANIILKVCDVKVIESGLENFQENKTCIFMSNHRSYFDLMALMRVLPGNYRAVAKKSLFYIPLFGWALWITGFISIDRGNRKKAFMSIDKAAKKIASGTSVLIFPEGTRNPEGKGLLPFKKGAFHLALKAGVPIIPIAIKGSSAILPKKSLRISPGTMEIIVGHPIETSSYDNKEELLLKTREIMLCLLGDE